MPSLKTVDLSKSYGGRTVVRSEERALLESMIREEFCGRVAQIAGAVLLGGAARR